MKRKRIKQLKGLKHQQGVTLIELLIAGVISLIAVSGMILVMATTLGSTTQTIEMTRLTQEMRTGMQIMTRELRRANYHADFLQCYGNTECLGVGTLNVEGWIKPVTIMDNTNAPGGTTDCFWIWYDRPNALALASEYVAAFRRATTSDGVGMLQMTTTADEESDFNCSTVANWVDITDPNIIDVLSFTVDECVLNAESIRETVNTAGHGQYVGKIGLNITAKLTVDPSVVAWIQSQNGAGATRELDEFIKVRNNVVAAVVANPCP